MPLTPDQVAQRYESGLASAGKKYSEGIDAFQGSAPQLAAAAADHWQNRVSSSEAKQNFVRGLTKPGVEESWRRNAKEIGAARLAGGAKKGRPKFMAALQILLPAAERSKSAARELRRQGADYLQRVASNAEIMRSAFGKM